MFWTARAKQFAYQQYWTKYEYRSYKEDFLSGWTQKTLKHLNVVYKYATNEKRLNVPELIKNSFIEGWNYSPSTHWYDTQNVIQLHADQVRLPSVLSWVKLTTHKLD